MRHDLGENTRPAARWFAHRWIRRVGFIATAVAVGLAASFITYGSSVEPGAALVKAVFEAKPEVQPPANFRATSRTVVESGRIRLVADGAPIAHMNIYAPAKRGTSTRPIILWVHGGGFVSSSADTVKDYAILLASHGYIVANLDYTLAPEAKHPVPVRQANAALSYLHDHAVQFGGDPTDVFIGGDSAGAQIASETASAETNPALAARLHIHPAIAPENLHGAILFCGLYDMDTVGGTGFPGLRTYLWAYTGSRNWTDYRNIAALSTTSTATSRFPATFISVGDADPLHGQSSKLTAALEARGVSVTTLFWNGTGDNLGHEYQFDFAHPQASTALSATLRFLTDHQGQQ